MGLPRITFPIILLVGLALIIAGVVTGSKNGFFKPCAAGQVCPSDMKKMTNSMIMLIIGIVLSIGGGMGVGWEYKSVGRVADLFSLQSM